MSPLRDAAWQSIALATLLVAVAAGDALADGAALLESQCAACHQLEAPTAPAADVLERQARQAPPLWYAGDKFRREWLKKWLQEPVAIRPAGYQPMAHVIAGADGDSVDAAALAAHPALSAADAAAVADVLMTKQALGEVIAATRYEPGEIALRMGQMNFSKFKGCDGCHRDAPDRGGVSGPELHTAWERLQPAFLAAWIADPVAVDPLTIMPRAGLNDAEVKKLADYLRAIGETQP